MVKMGPDDKTCSLKKKRILAGIFETFVETYHQYITYYNKQTDPNITLVLNKVL